ncbi:MAG: hypothetical protein GEU82_18305 [Luteitalea sp.]|nr:hypothetical protein [Luteitalea sp.]
MRKPRTVVIVVAALAVSFAPGLSAKGRTVKVTVSSPSAVQPIDITDPTVIAPTVWGGEFIGARTSEPDRSLMRYRLAFHVEPPREKARVMYTVSYVRDPRKGTAFIYLPGPSDEGYRLNIGTIYRDGQDGRWFLAEPNWSAALNAAMR